MPVIASKAKQSPPVQAGDCFVADAPRRDRLMSLVGRRAEAIPTYADGDCFPTHSLSLAILQSLQYWDVRQDFGTGAPAGLGVTD